MPFVTKRLKRFRSVTNHVGEKRQKRQAGRTDRSRSGSTGTHLLSVGHVENPQGTAGHDSSLPEPTQCTILFPLPD
jgi:hypothetical protein